MRGMPRTVIALGVVSFFTDLSSEMIYPLLPVFLTSVLGAGALALGVIEGVAETTAGFLKVVSGVWTDRVARRKPFILAGYGLAGLVRPLIGLAPVWPVVLGLRFADRLGKGLRTSPRDAMIVDVADPTRRGAAFGFQRMMDHAGAMIGPLVAAALLSLVGLGLRWVFVLAAVPAALVMVVLLTAVKESPAERHAAPGGSSGLHWKELPLHFKVFLAGLLLFTLGNSTDAFILLRLSEAGVSATWLAALWSVHHAVKTLASLVGGRLSDRLGPRTMILTGWAVYAAIYLAFAAFQSTAALIVVFVLYGLYFGFVEPSERAFTADLAPQPLRGTALGFYHGTIGLGALPASLIFGALWAAFGPATAFTCGALLALSASVIVASIPRQ